MHKLQLHLEFRRTRHTSVLTLIRPLKHGASPSVWKSVKYLIGNMFRSVTCMYTTDARVAVILKCSYYIQHECMSILVDTPSNSDTNSSKLLGMTWKKHAKMHVIYAQFLSACTDVSTLVVSKKALCFIPCPHGHFSGRKRWRSLLPISFCPFCKTEF